MQQQHQNQPLPTKGKTAGTRASCNATLFVSLTEPSLFIDRMTDVWPVEQHTPSITHANSCPPKQSPHGFFVSLKPCRDRSHRWLFRNTSVFTMPSPSFT